MVPTETSICVSATYVYMLSSKCAHISEKYNMCLKKYSHVTQTRSQLKCVYVIIKPSYIRQMGIRALFNTYLTKCVHAFYFICVVNTIPFLFNELDYLPGLIFITRATRRLPHAE